MGLDKVDKPPQEVPDDGDPSRFMDVSLSRWWCGCAYFNDGADEGAGGGL